MAFKLRVANLLYLLICGSSIFSRIGRVVDGTGLENRTSEMARRFESFMRR